MSERYITPAFFCIDQTKRQFSIIVFQIMVLNYEKSKSEKFPRLSAHTYTQSPEYYVVRKLKVYCNSSNCNVWNIFFGSMAFLECEEIIWDGSPAGNKSKDGNRTKISADVWLYRAHWIERHRYFSADYSQTSRYLAQTDFRRGSKRLTKQVAVMNIENML